MLRENRLAEVTPPPTQDGGHDHLLVRPGWFGPNGKFLA